MADVNHTNRKHALLSASGASRWMNCTPSARLEEKFQESQRSVYAEEGTLAHEFGDLALRLRNGEIDEKIYNKEVKKLKRDKLYSPEMDEEVGKYVDIVWEKYLAAQAKNGDALLLVEERVDFSHLVQGGFGTGDATIISGKTLYIDDLKYGRGIKVDADDNPQLKLYGSGALRAFEMMYDIDTVVLSIIQPRLNHYSTWEISADDLRTWGQKIVRPKALKAYEGKGVQKAGDWCKFCKVKAMCATLAAKNIKLAQLDFTDPHFLTDSQLLDVHKQIPMLVDWANAVKKHLLDEALNGKEWPGYKVVAGKSNRIWTDEKAVREALELGGFDEDGYIVEKLANLTTVETFIGKQNFQQYLKDLVVKPQGAPTLVPMADKRPAIIGTQSAQDDFKD